ncbi:hypothetical protein CAter10_2545 [Collimonas arenae]|nr:hypothetical protein CAter10_2545 [Collimonas arenae]
MIWPWPLAAGVLFHLRELYRLEALFHLGRCTACRCCSAGVGGIHGSAAAAL